MCRDAFWEFHGTIADISDLSVEFFQTVFSLRFLEIPSVSSTDSFPHNDILQAGFGPRAICWTQHATN